MPPPPPPAGEGSGAAVPDADAPAPEVAATEVALTRCTHGAYGPGERCENDAILGGTVCVDHGGNTARARAHAEAKLNAARERIVDLLPDAAQVLAELLSADSENVRLAAAVRVLDQNGLQVVKKSEVHGQFDHEFTFSIDSANRPDLEDDDADVIEGDFTALDDEDEEAAI